MSGKKGKKKASPEPGCKHAWEPVSAKQVGVVHALIDQARTIVVLRCATCGWIGHYVLPGHWELHEVKRRG